MSTHDHDPLSTHDHDPLTARFAALAPRPLPGDWGDVLDRAGIARTYADSADRADQRIGPRSGRLLSQ